MKLITLALCAALAGCMTRPISNEEATSAPPARILAPALLQPSATSGKVTVKRERAIGGSACSSRVFIDAKPVADLYVGEKVVIYLPAGEYIFGAWPNGICVGSLSEVRATVRAEAEITFRIGYGGNGDFKINETAF